MFTPANSRSPSTASPRSFDSGISVSFSPSIASEAGDFFHFEDSPPPDSPVRGYAYSREVGYNIISRDVPAESYLHDSDAASFSPENQSLNASPMDPRDTDPNSPTVLSPRTPPGPGRNPYDHFHTYERYNYEGFVVDRYDNYEGDMFPVATAYSNADGILPVVIDVNKFSVRHSFVTPAPGDAHALLDEILTTYHAVTPYKNAIRAIYFDGTKAFIMSDIPPIRR